MAIQATSNLIHRISSIPKFNGNLFSANAPKNPFDHLGELYIFQLPDGPKGSKDGPVVQRLDLLI